MTERIPIGDCIHLRLIPPFDGGPGMVCVACDYILLPPHPRMALPSDAAPEVVRAALERFVRDSEESS